MALPVNSIGAFVVRNWAQGPPPPPLQRIVEVMTYPGVNYEALRLHEYRSGVFQLTSMSDAPTVAAGRTLTSNYATLVGSGPVQLIWNDDDYDLRGLRVMVVHVSSMMLRRRLVICGATSLGNTVDVMTRWDLVYTQYTP